MCKPVCYKQDKKLLVEIHRNGDIIMKDAIANSLIKLMNEHAYHEITITMICREVPVSRTAFYRYFSGKDSILKYCVIRDYEKKCLPIFRFHLKEIGTACFFTYIIESADFYRRLYDIDQGRLLMQCLKSAYRVGFERRDEYSLPSSKKVSGFDPEVFFEYACTGIAAVVTIWIKNGMKRPVDQIAKDLYVMMSEPLGDVRDKYT